MLSVIVHRAAGQEVDLDRPVALISAVKPARVRHRVSAQPVCAFRQVRAYTPVYPSGHETAPLCKGALR